MRHVTFNPGKSSELGGPVLPSLHRVTRAGLELKFFFLNGWYFCCMWQILHFFFSFTPYFFFRPAKFVFSCYASNGCRHVAFFPWMHCHCRARWAIGHTTTFFDAFKRVFIFLSGHLFAFLFHCCRHPSAYRLFSQAYPQSFFCSSSYPWNIDICGAFSSHVQLWIVWI